MADLSFTLEIITPDGIIYNEEVSEVMLPTPKGQIAILPHHVALFAKLVEGEIVIQKNGKESLMAVLGGIAEVSDNSVKILSDYAVKADSIVMARAQEAKKRAEEALLNKKSNEDFALLDQDLKKSILELKVAEKVRKKSL